MSNKLYYINEIFYSIAGEGVRAGTPNIFIRFSGCNLKCAKDDEMSGFDCDTEFLSGKPMTKEQIYDAICNLSSHNCKNIIFTGGEPFLQLDQELIDYFKDTDPLFPKHEFFLAVETNGTIEPKFDLKMLDWICVSPKSAEHTLNIVNPHKSPLKVNELKYVRNLTQSIPRPALRADHYLISPAMPASGLGFDARETIAHCVELVKQNPHWRLSLQLHKLLGVR